MTAARWFCIERKEFIFEKIILQKHFFPVKADRFFSTMNSRFKFTAALFFFILFPVNILFVRAHPSKINPAGQETIVHVVKKSETVFSIAKKYKVTTAEIKKWNKLKGNNIRVGQKLIVGYSKKKPALSVKTIQKTPQPLRQLVRRIPEVKKAEPPPAQKQVLQEKKKEKVPEPFNAKMKNISEEGFASWIDDEDINTGKFLALHRTAPVGTIIKVTNYANKKSVYVKVVGKIPAREELNVILIQLSKTATDKLEVREARFNAVLNYSVPE